MPRGVYGLDYIGLEFETVDTHPNVIMNMLDSHYWRSDHDASIERDGRILANGLILNSFPNNLSPHFSNATLGTEIVLNPPINMDNSSNMLEILENLTDRLMELGEPETTTRAGVHVHISAPINLRLLKAYTKFGAHVEDLFYYLGGQGYTFRGMLINHNAYCRPITQWGPPVVPCNNGGFAQVFDVEDLLAANTTAEFWSKYGNVNPNSELPRYHPTRYTWLNLYSLLYHGSLEFRVFNTTLNPYFIYAEILFCKAFVESCLSMAFSKDPILKSLEINSIYNDRPVNQILNTFNTITDSMELDRSTIRTLGDIISRTPPVKLEKEYIFTHLRNLRTFNFNNRKNIRYLDSSECIDPQIVDIHQLRGER